MRWTTSSGPLKYGEPVGQLCGVSLGVRPYLRHGETGRHGTLTQERHLGVGVLLRGAISQPNG